MNWKQIGCLLCSGGVIVLLMIIADHQNDWETSQINTWLNGVDPRLGVISQNRSHHTWISDPEQKDIPRCDVYQFRNELLTEGPHPNIPRHLIGGCSRVIYNRIPKCASRTMKDAFNQAGPFNNYTPIFIKRGYDAKRDMKLYLTEMKSVENSRFVLTSHHYFVNFTQYLNQTIVFINIAREPVSWFVSMFNWQKHTAVQDGWWSQMPIGECIRKDRCVEAVRSFFGSMSFLCGPGNKCKSYTNKSLQRALKHVDRDYILVGVYEQLREVNVVLEYLMPHMFNHLPQYFDEIAKNGSQIYRTAIKDNVTTEELALLKRKLHLENELYAFIKQKFNRLLSIVRKATKNFKS